MLLVYALLITDSSSLPQDRGQDVVAIAEFQRKMLAAFFICFHHGGNIQFKVVDNDDLSSDVFLPFEPATVTLDEAGDGWVRKIIDQYESRMIAGSSA